VSTSRRAKPGNGSRPSTSAVARGAAVRPMTDAPSRSRRSLRPSAKPPGFRTADPAAEPSAAFAASPAAALASFLPRASITTARMNRIATGSATATSLAIDFAF